MEFIMLTTLFSKTSPYALGLGLYLASLIYRFGPGANSILLGLSVPILATAAYTFFINKELFKRSFKEKAALFQLAFGMIIEELLVQRFSGVFKNMDPAVNIPALIVIMIATILIFWLLNYLFITLGNKLGLYALKKLK